MYICFNIARLSVLFFIPSYLPGTLASSMPHTYAVLRAPYVDCFISFRLVCLIKDLKGMPVSQCVKECKNALQRYRRLWIQHRWPSHRSSLSSAWRWGLLWLQLPREPATCVPVRLLTSALLLVLALSMYSGLALNLRTGFGKMICKGF
jgi:hypothetical protein